MSFMRIRVNQVRAQSPDIASLAEQLNGLGKPYQKEVIAVGGETILTLDKPYEVGSRDLKVKWNGSDLIPTSGKGFINGDYHEIDPYTIELLNPAEEKDVFILRLEGKGQGVALAVDHYHVYREVPTGVVDGINNVFQLKQVPKPGTENVFVNGLYRYPPGDYTIVEDTITFAIPPGVDENGNPSIILVNYEVYKQ